MCIKKSCEPYHAHIHLIRRSLNNEVGVFDDNIVDVNLFCLQRSGAGNIDA